MEISMNDKYNHPTQYFVHKFINWEKVEERLSKYKYIDKYFPISTLKSEKFTEEPPFYCHYLAWRLGVWKNEQFFEYFNHLLENAETINGWNGKKRIQNENEFGQFWSFLWELQVAEFLTSFPNLQVNWNVSNGPDLHIQKNSEELFVECKTVHKSFGLENFIEEVLNQIDKTIRVSHGIFMKFSLSQDNKRIILFDSIFRPFLDPAFIENKKIEVQKVSPLIIVEYIYPNFFIYLENSDAKPASYELLSKIYSASDPIKYTDVIYKEIINKVKENNLESCHPNLLFVNLVLSKDWQLACGWNNQHNLPQSQNLDNILLTACDIDKPANYNGFKGTINRESKIIQQLLNIKP